MQLYLHIGTEKTGSSYLQSMAATNRDLLKKASIYFPDGSLEAQMQNWEISNGNAQLLADYLLQDNYQPIKDFLKRRKKEAENNQCNSLLLSNELLVLAFNNKEKISKFIHLASDLGFSSVNILLVLRNPVDQALSLYKHRAKGGDTPPIEAWVTNHYYYGKGILDFFQAIGNRNIQLTYRKYSSTEGALDRLFFQDWLNMPNKLLSPPKTVNPSLTLSELFLIRTLKQKNPWITQKLYDRLVKIHKKDKAVEPKITAYYKSILFKEIQRYKQTWEHCNQKLPPDEQLILEESTFDGTIDEINVASFNETQCQAIANFIDETASFSFLARILLEKIKRNLSTIKSAFSKLLTH